LSNLENPTPTDHARCGCPHCAQALKQIVFGYLLEQHGGFVEIPLRLLDELVLGGAAYLSLEIKSDALLVKVLSGGELQKDVERRFSARPA